MKYAKAVAGALVAGLGTLGTALADGHVSGVEWTTIAISVILASGLVAAIPNREPGLYR